MSAEDALSDETARLRIRDETQTTLFVEAGAGSGKTQSLVSRVTKLVLSDSIELAGIVAVTFTEKAGAELRDRLRAKFESVWRDDPDKDRGGMPPNKLCRISTRRPSARCIRLLSAS